MGSCFDYNSYTLLVLDCATMSGSQIVDESQNLERMNGQIGKEAENDTRAGEKNKVGLSTPKLIRAAALVAESLPPRDCWAVARGGVLVHEQCAATLACTFG